MKTARFSNTTWISAVAACLWMGAVGALAAESVDDLLRDPEIERILATDPTAEVRKRSVPLSNAEAPMGKEEARLRAERLRALARWQAEAAKNPADARAWREVGIAHLRLDVEPEKAIQAFKKSQRLDPNQPRIHFLLGEACRRNGNHRLALREFDLERQAAGDSPELRFLRGQTYLAMNRRDDARAEFEPVTSSRGAAGKGAKFNLALIDIAEGKVAEGYAALRRAAPDMLRPATLQLLRGDQAVDLAQAIIGAPAALARQLGAVPRLQPMLNASRFRADVNLRVEYDDNVHLVDADELLPRDADRDDFRFVGSIYSDLLLWRGANAQAGLRGDFYSSVHFEESSLDYFSFGFEPYLSWRTVSGRGWFEISPFASYSLVGGDSYEFNAGAALSALWQHAERFSTIFTYRLNGRDVLLDPSRPATDRDGWVNTFGVIESFNVNDSIQLYVGGNIALERTDGSDYDRNRYTVFASANFRLPLEFYGRLGYSFRYDDFLNGYSGSESGHARRDEVHTLSIRLSRLISRSAEWYAEYRYTDCDSTFAHFDYQSNVIGLGVVMRF